MPRRERKLLVRPSFVLTEHLLALVGGSIRIPAHYCGIVGFKPTPSLLSKKGSAIPRFQSRNGQAIVLPTVGPLARSVRDCALMMEVLSSPEAR